MKARCPPDRRAEAEAGTSIVEVIVATTLLAIGVLVVLTSFGAADEAADAGDRRSTAARLAGSELEAVRAFAYDEVGIALTDADYVRRFERRPTVTGAVNRVEAVGFAEIDGTRYEVRRHITWSPIEVRGVTNREGYKLVTVVVRWTDTVGDHEVRQDTGLYEATTP